LHCRLSAYTVLHMSDLFVNDPIAAPPSAPLAQSLAQVLVPMPIDKAYSYSVPADIDVQLGDYVAVPLGSRMLIGVVWNLDQDYDGNPNKLKEIAQKYDLPPMGQAQRDFIDFMAKYTLSALGAVLKLCLSAPSAFDLPKETLLYKLAPDIEEFSLQKLSPKRKAVLGSLKDGTPRRAADIARDAGCSASVVKAMGDGGYLRALLMPEIPPCTKPDPTLKGAELLDSQRLAADELVAAVSADNFETFLLDGVTGAGKTEVYFEAIAQALKEDKQIILMLPEIALSNAFLDRFAARFGTRPALWHSALSTAMRRKTWRGVAEGKTKVVVGARSALFLPYRQLGLIIVDEEHEPAYKQEDGVLYHARDMAILRANKEQCPVVLVSATPAIETIYNAWQGRYHHLTLESRFGSAGMPDVHILNLKQDRPERQAFLAPSLVTAIRETVERGEQALLFLNRRGYAPLTLCRGCGHRMQCPRCTAWLVEHRRSNKLHCHHCGYYCSIPKNCPECNDEDSFAACGPGVERIAEELGVLFPEYRQITLSSDDSDDPDALRERLQEIRDGEYDLIIGTQIIAKGHHFPKLTTVGVVDADLGLSGGDLRATERCYQLLHQVAGRAGREDVKGAVYLQSYSPQSKVLQALASGDRDAFLDAECFEREAAHMPPFSRLVGVIVAGRDEAETEKLAYQLGRAAPRAEGVNVFGPAPAPLARLRGKYRFRLLVQADKNLNIQKAISAWLKSVKIPSTITVRADIDPQSFF
jgi:primosomal protein N' (replication factor Y)